MQVEGMRKNRKSLPHGKVSGQMFKKNMTFAKHDIYKVSPPKVFITKGKMVILQLKIGRDHQVVKVNITNTDVLTCTF